jgi:hypothetical protein
MKRTMIVAAAGLFAMSLGPQAHAAFYAEYYRDNLFLGLAFHRVACLTDWFTIQSDQDYDGFTNKRYCSAQASADSVPDGTWYDYRASAGAEELDACGALVNEQYDTPNYAGSSETCNYNILFDCNSDCWIREFSACQSGSSVSTLSPCL